MTSSRWQFWIDVGGTFTDCVARSPEGGLVTEKVLSSGAVKGRIGEGSAGVRIVDPLRAGDPPGFWSGWRVRSDESARSDESGREFPVVDSDSGGLVLESPVPESLIGRTYELRCDEPAPLICIRRVLGLRLDEPIPPADVRMGTTRGTNALLERKGAQTAFITTHGFADILLIGNQDRPELFTLNIRKPAPLYHAVIEIEERIAADGAVLVPLNERQLRESLERLCAEGIESLAICLLHAYRNPEHELAVEAIAREAGFVEISRSSDVAPVIKLVSRAETTVLDAYLTPVLRSYVQDIRGRLHGPRRGGKDSGFRSQDSGIPAENVRRKQNLETFVARSVESPESRVESATASSQHSTLYAQLKLMTSHGGLIDGEEFSGKDCILSGPAGGVIGYSVIARRAGFTQAIGFDMGGTSTDVSRVQCGEGRESRAEGQGTSGERQPPLALGPQPSAPVQPIRYELEQETVKAGVRIAAPTLAIETVAAGGGSICTFDGVQLRVGPESAGADPGPACYGRGGPLTVTDLNVVLGRVLPEHFPFPLDVDAIHDRLHALVEEIAASPLGRRYTPRELAQGFLDIANETMARAIRRISIERGYDPAAHVLVSFGGAGGQHACAVARSLGISSILIHPFAGMLSAYGMGLADVRRRAEQAVLEPYADETLARIEPVFQELEARLIDEVRSEGISEQAILPPVRSLSLRYQGVESTIVIERDPETDCDYAAAYEAMHEQLYGYRHAGRGLEVVALHVEVIGAAGGTGEEGQRGRGEEGKNDSMTNPQSPMTNRSRIHSSLSSPSPHPVFPPSPLPLFPSAPLPPPPTVWHANRPHSAPVALREQLAEGDELTGPAILCDAGSTIWIEPGFQATIGAEGMVLMRRVEDAGEDEVQPAGSDAAGQHERAHRENDVSRSPEVDPVLLELFNNRFASIAEQMGVTLRQTSISTNVKERLDYSCALFDAQGGLVVNAPHIPVHLGAMSETVRCLIRDNPDLAPGDVFITNDPYAGGSHLPDVTVVTPVHDPGSGTLLFFTASRAHHAEIGGITPGSMPPFSKNLAEEGVLIRNFKLVAAGRSRMDQLRELLTNGPYPSRSPEDNLADITAQVAANRKGATLLQELVSRESGAETVLRSMRGIQQAATLKMRRTLAAFPDGRYEFQDHLDDGSPVRVAITISGERATIDFSGTGPVLPTNLNANRAIVTAAVMYVFRCLIDEPIPLNGGVLEPLEIRLPECLLNPTALPDPGACAAVVGGNVETSQRVVDVLLGALGVAAASQGTMNNLTFGNETFGYYETICGGAGATPEGDGADAVHTHMTNTRLTDVEVLEHRYPVRIERFAIRRGSGGGSGAEGQGDRGAEGMGSGGEPQWPMTNPQSSMTNSVERSALSDESRENTQPSTLNAERSTIDQDLSLSHSLPSSPLPLSPSSQTHRGGDGVVRTFTFLAPLSLSLLTQRRGPYPPFGLHGAPPGALGRNLLQRAGANEFEDLGGSAHIKVHPGDRLTIETPGGGGVVIGKGPPE
jgi:5-oxoprolinase (ATP-hydrolysing)